MERPASQHPDRPSGTGDAPGLSLREIESRICAIARKDQRISAIYLFGSRTKGEAYPGSDVDLAVLFDEPQGLRDVVALEILFEDALRPEIPRVDLIDLAKAKPFLAFDVIRGERIYCTDSYRCDQFDLYVMRRAGDLASMEKERQRMLLDPERFRARRGGMP